MKLYSVYGSNNCRKVEAVINHLGLNVEIEYLSLMKGDLSKPEFICINPNGKVPVLVDGSFVLWESNSIMQYLCDCSPDQNLLPSDPAVRADITRWQCWEVAHFNKAFSTLVFESVLKQLFMQKPANQALMENATENLEQFADVLDRHMRDREYVVGEDLTLADYSITSLEGFKETIPFNWNNFTNLNLYFERMRSNPSWAATASERLASSA